MHFVYSVVPMILQKQHPTTKHKMCKVGLSVRGKGCTGIGPFNSDHTRRLMPNEATFSTQVWNDTA